MSHKRKKTNNGRNRTAKSRKSQSARRNGNDNYRGILEVDTIKQAEMKEKKKRNEHL